MIDIETKKHPSAPYKPIQIVYSGEAISSTSTFVLIQKTHTEFEAELRVVVS